VPRHAIGDFHCHSSRSDGTLSPTDVVQLAASRGVRTLALTDHDTLLGLDEARAAAAAVPGFRLVPGVELSCDLPGTELHLLGLFVDDQRSEFVRELDRMRHARIARAERMVQALQDLGAPVSWERVQEIAGEASIGRPHVARALVEAGHATNVNDAFDRYLDTSSPAYVPRERLAPVDALALIQEGGGVGVFAHPPFTDDHARHLPELVAAGLFGLEVYYRHYDAETVDALRQLADSHGLVASGGSDYHGLDREHEHEPGDIPLPDDAVDLLLEAAAAHGVRIPDPTAP
jgi:predicted metal-dependent phosphoesterase TrpH